MNKRLAISIMCTGIIFTGIGLYITAGGEAAGRAVQTVKVERVLRQDISSVISAGGVVEEIKKKDIYAVQPLRILSLYIKKGDKVKKGDKLIEYDLDEINSQYEQLLISKKIQEIVAQKLETAEDYKSITAFTSAVYQAENAITLAQDNYRQLELNSKKMGYDSKTAEIALNDAKIAVENAKYAYSISKSNLYDALETNDRVESGRKLDLDIQRENLEAILLKIKDTENLINKINSSMLSPISGVIAEVNAVEGSCANLQIPVTKVINMDYVRIKASVKEFDISKVRLGQYVRVSGDALEPSAFIKGKVTEIAPVVRKKLTASGDESLVDIIVSLDKHYPSLLPGLSVTCKVTTDERDNTPVINFMAIKEDKDGDKSIFIVDKNGNLRERSIRLGISSEMNAEVTYGVMEGDMVVLNWQPAFKTGDRAKIIEEDR